MPSFEPSISSLRSVQSTRVINDLLISNLLFLCRSRSHHRTSLCRAAQEGIIPAGELEYRAIPRVMTIVSLPPKRNMYIGIFSNIYVSGRRVMCQVAYIEAAKQQLEQPSFRNTCPEIQAAPQSDLRVSTHANKQPNGSLVIKSALGKKSMSVESARSDRLHPPLHQCLTLLRSRTCDPPRT